MGTILSSFKKSGSYVPAVTGEFAEVSVEDISKVSVIPFDPSVLKISVWAVIEPKLEWTSVINRAVNPNSKSLAMGRELFSIFPDKPAAVKYAQSQNKYLIILEIHPDAEIIPQLPLVKEIIVG
jgi:hypothetical protein